MTEGVGAQAINCTILNAPSQAIPGIIQVITMSHCQRNSLITWEAF
jgi:hypothetical protein